MNKSFLANATAVTTYALTFILPTVGQAHDSPNHGHIPKDVNYGFEVVGDIQAGASPPLFPMIREPR